VGDPYRDGSESVQPSEARVREALRTWARSVPGGPRRLDEQITGIDMHDEVVVRVATEIVRRDLVERRAAAHARAQGSGEIVHPAVIDPFSTSLDALRTRTQHSAPCTNCGGSGLAGCPGCNATGRAACSSCGGTGRTYEKSKRGAKCKVCRETGQVQCPTCSGTAKVACRGCGGSGQHLVWWEYEESVRTVASFLSDSPILLAHRHLCDHRFLSQRDLESFSPFVTVQHAGPIPEDALDREDVAALARTAPAIDPRLERVRAQQFLRFGVVGRYARYEMCGMTGTVALSGATLLGASTPDALRPIHRRLIVLAAATVILLVLASSWHASFSGPTAYFATSNQRITAVLVVGVAAALAAAAGALRRLRPGFGWWPSNRFERVTAVVFVAAFALAPLIAFVARPTTEKARTAIAAGDLDRAAVVVEALRATRSSAEVTEVSDALTIAEAERLSGNARIAKLDEAAAHSGPHADQARDRGRRARVETVQAALAARQPAEALASLDRWSSELAAAPEAPELRAQAYDQKVASCTDAACSFLAARSADAAHTSPARVDALGTARQQVLAALDPKEASDADPLKRVRTLRRAATLGSLVLAATPDAQLSEKATAAGTALEVELAKVLLLGAPVALVDEVLTRPNAGSPLTGWRELEGVAVYPADVGGRCTGLYVVGAAAGSRSLTGKEPGLRRLLAQATGRSTVAIHPRPRSAKEQEGSRWTEGSTQVLARWNGEALMELRIGDAAP
jgi:hypothetical protein